MIVIDDDTAIQRTLEERKLWDSFLTGTGLILDRNETCDVFLRAPDGFVWITGLGEKLAKVIFDKYQGELNDQLP